MDCIIALTALMLAATPHAHAAAPDTSRIEQLAGAVGKVFARIKEPGTPLPHADIDPAQTQLETEKLGTILGHHGDLSGGVYKVTIGRSAQMHGHPIGNTMGVNTWVAFSGTN